MKTPHKHAELIKAWADGAEIQFRYNANIPWSDVKGVCGWDVDCEFRVKPEPKSDIEMTRKISILVEPCPHEPNGLVNVTAGFSRNVRFVFDGETRKLKSVEML